MGWYYSHKQFYGALIHHYRDVCEIFLKKFTKSSSVKQNSLHSCLKIRIRTSKHFIEKFVLKIYKKEEGLLFFKVDPMKQTVKKRYTSSFINCSTAFISTGAHFDDCRVSLVRQIHFRIGSSTKKVISLKIKYYCKINTHCN